MTKKDFFTKLESVKGVGYFFIILLASHFFWKFFVIGDELNNTVTLLGIDISYPFIFMAEHTAHFTEWFINSVSGEISLYPNNILRYENQQGVRIVWGCTGIKQAYIFITIIGFYYGSWRHKMWYIPLGLGVIYLFNLLRILAVTLAIKTHPEWFYFLHEYLLKYLFYIIIFILWVIWDMLFVVQKKG